jgi:hypothetical protein
VTPAVHVARLGHRCGRRVAFDRHDGVDRAAAQRIPPPARAEIRAGADADVSDRPGPAEPRLERAQDRTDVGLGAAVGEVGTPERAMHERRDGRALGARAARPQP